MGKLDTNTLRDCWLCRGLGGVALHEQWSARRGKPLWTAHEYPSDDPHPTRPCPACSADAQVAAERERAIKVLDNFWHWLWMRIEESPDEGPYALALQDAARGLRNLRDDYDHALSVDWQRYREDARIARGQP